MNSIKKFLQGLHDRSALFQLTSVWLFSCFVYIQYKAKAEQSSRTESAQNLHRTCTESAQEQEQNKNRTRTRTRTEQEQDKLI